VDLEELRFSKNSADLSSEGGFQFEFYCDRCGSAWRSRFEACEHATASEALDAAGSILGGLVGRAAGVADRAQTIAWQKAHDLAFSRAAAEYQQRFHRCQRCTQYVCERCWDRRHQLCVNCVSDAATEAAAAQKAARAPQGAGKGAAERGAAPSGSGPDASHAAPAVCPKCQAPLDAGAKFCAACGTRLGAAQFCSECGAQLKPGAKFCSGCGHQVEA